MHMKKIFGIIIIMFLLPWKAFPAFLETGSLSARAKGMGNSFLSVADDASAAVYNPAGLSQAQDYQIFFNYAKPFAGVELVDFNYTCFSVVFPVKNAGALGIGWNGFRATGLYEEYSFLISYGVSLGEFFSPGLDKISLGLSAKYLFHGFQLDQRTADDPVFMSGKGKGNAGLDAGLLLKELWTGLPGLRIGLAVKNINEPDAGLFNADPVYREYGIGFSYLFKGRGKKRPVFMPGLDILYKNGEFDLYAGVETVFFNSLLAARAGANKSEATAGLGASFEIRRLVHFDLNYAFAFPLGIRGSYGSHGFSLQVKF